MAHSVLRIQGMLHKTPLLMSAKHFNVIDNYLSKRNNGGITFDTVGDAFEGGGVDYEMPESYNYNMDTKVGVIYLEGSLTYKATGWEALCGGANYLQLEADVKELIGYGAEKIVFMVDSGGGEAYGCFETARNIRKMCDEANVKIYSYVDGCACSAAYALACIADVFVANPQAEVGSIGVVVGMIDDSKALEMEGYKRVFVFAGDNKVPYDENGALSASFIESTQSTVNTLYQSFVEHVSNFTGLTAEQVVATKASCYLGTEAAALGLIDKVLERNDFAAFLADEEIFDDAAERVVCEGEDEDEMPDSDPDIGNGGKKKKCEQEMPMFGKQKSNENVAHLQASLVELQEGKAALAAELADVKEKLQSANDQLSVFLAQKAEAEKLEKEKAEQAKLDARKAKASSVIPSDQLEAQMAILAGVSDEAFDLVMQTFEAKIKAEKGSDLFNEIGLNGDGDSEKQASSLLQAIKQKYSK